jgi:hypothetical protein
MHRAHRRRSPQETCCQGPRGWPNAHGSVRIEPWSRDASLALFVMAVPFGQAPRDFLGAGWNRHPQVSAVRGTKPCTPTSRGFSAPVGAPVHHDLRTHGPAHARYTRRAVSLVHHDRRTDAYATRVEMAIAAPLYGAATMAHLTTTTSPRQVAHRTSARRPRRARHLRPARRV